MRRDIKNHVKNNRTRHNDPSGIKIEVTKAIKDRQYHKYGSLGVVLQTHMQVNKLATCTYTEASINLFKP